MNYHPTAIIETNVIGKNTQIWAFTHICAGARIGDNCIIGEGVYIGPNVIIGNNCKIQNHTLLYEGVSIEDDVFIGPNVITTNDLYPKAGSDWRDRFRETCIKKGSSVGANTTIVCGITIGENTLIGAGSVVTKDMKANSVCYGNPCIHKRNK